MGIAGESGGTRCCYSNLSDHIIVCVYFRPLVLKTCVVSVEVAISPLKRCRVLGIVMQISHPATN